jgi:hypothetical protein
MSVFRCSYPEEVIDTKSQVSASGECVHHQEAVNVQPESIGEEQEHIAIRLRRVGGSHVCIDSFDLFDCSCRLSGVDVAFETTEVGWLGEDSFHDVN